MNKQEVLEWVITQKFFKHERIQIDPHHAYAMAYVDTYSGSFSFMVDMKRKRGFDHTYSAQEIAAILNCARREAKDNGLSDGKVTKSAELKASAEQIKEMEAIAEIKRDELAEFADAIPPEYLNDDMRELFNTIATLEKELKAFKSANAVDFLNFSIKENESAEKSMRAEYQQLLSSLQAKRVELMQQLQTFQRQIVDLENQINALKKQYQDQVKLMAAQQKLDIIKSDIDEMVKDCFWNDKIKEFQRNDVYYMAAAYQMGKNGIVNANPTGAGKTLEFAAFYPIFRQFFYQNHGRLPVTLFLTKKSLVDSTFDEFKLWNPEEDMRAVKIAGILDKDIRNFMIQAGIMSNAVVITNYDALDTTPILMQTKWDLVVMDEVHKVKGGAQYKPTQIFLNTKNVAKDAEFILCMSGTPIMNHPAEMWCYLHIFDPVRFPDLKMFKRQYLFGYGERDAKGDLIMNVNWDTLVDRVLRGRVIKHPEDEVKKDLPGKAPPKWYNVDMNGCQKKVYDKARDEFWVWLDSQGNKALSFASIIAQLTRLRQIAVLPASIRYSEDGIKHNLDCWDSAKIDEAMDILEELTDEGEQVIVVSSQFEEPIWEVQRRVEKLGIPCDTITGADTQKNLVRTKEIRFQQGETKVIVVNAKTAGEGLNFQKSPDRWPGGASHMIFLDYWWNPGAQKQMEDRLFRFGQTDRVIIHNLYLNDSVDAFVLAKVNEKREMITGIMERNEYKTSSDWRDFLRGMI